MKSCFAVLGFVFVAGCFCGKPMLSMTRVDFKVEGPICVKPFSILRPTSRYESYLDVGCETVSKPMNKLFLNYTLAIKAAGAKNFRQFIKLTNVDVCNSFKDVSKLSLWKEIQIANNTFQGILHKCPYSSFKFYNVSNGGAWDQNNESNGNPLPNGIYRHRIAVSDDLIQPKNKIILKFFSEVKIHSFNFLTNI